MTKKAFTLTEVIITIAIVAILAAVTLPRIGGRDYLKLLELRTISYQLASDIRYTRRLAISNSRNYFIQIVTNEDGTKTYDIYEGTPELPVGKFMVRSFPQTIPAAINVTGATEFTFQPFGNPRLGGIVTLGSVRLRGQDYSYEITVEPVTGAAITRALITQPEQ